MTDAAIDRLESRHAIETLVADYAHGFDGRNLDTFLDIWWEDGVIVAPPPIGTVQGRAALAALVEEQLWPTWRWSMHVISNATVAFADDTPDAATGRSNVLCIGHNEHGIGTILTATYRDCYERRAGVWKIAERTVDLRWGGTASDFAGVASTGG